MDKKQYLLCSAIWYQDLPTAKNLPKNCDRGVVVCGWRHGNIIATVLSLTGLRTVQFGPNSVGKSVQGFLTNDNLFVDREEAGAIAYKSGQIAEPNNHLFSEDVW